MLIVLRENLFLQDINTTPIEPKTERAYVVAVNSCFAITVVRQDAQKQTEQRRSVEKIHTVVLDFIH